MKLSPFKQIPKECVVFMLFNSIFESGRLFVVCISNLYFISFQLPLQDFAILKIVQLITVIIFDIPVGFLIVKLGKYRSMMTALLFGLIGCSGYIFSRSLPSFIVSEFFLACSLAIWTGTFVTLFTDVINAKNPKLIDKYFHLNESITQIFVICSGIIGAWIFQRNKYLPYVLFFISYAFLVCALKFFCHNFHQESSQKICIKIPRNIYLTKLLPIVFMMIFIQFALQPLLHYWQLFFMKKFSLNSKSLSLIFFCYSLFSSISYYIYSYILKYYPFTTIVFISILFFLVSIAYFFISSISSLQLSVAIFAIVFALLNIVKISINTLLQKVLNENNRVIMTKFANWIARFGGIISLQIIHLTISQNNNVVYMYHILSVITVFLAISMLLFAFANSRNFS